MGGSGVRWLPGERVWIWGMWNQLCGRRAALRWQRLIWLSELGVMDPSGIHPGVKAGFSPGFFGRGMTGAVSR